MVRLRLQHWRDSILQILEQRRFDSGFPISHATGVRITCELRRY